MNKKVTFSVFVALFSLSAYAQCPTNISDPDGDGGRYFLTLSSLAQCSTAPYNVAGTAVTLNGPANTYLTGNCTNNGNPAGPVIATIVYNAGTPIVLATSAPVTLRVGGSTCVYGSGGALPVELMSFSGKNTEGGNFLTWATGTEINNFGFDVERSIDGHTFIKIGMVKAQGKAANYTFTDKTPASEVGGRTYYRWKSMDNDQSFTYSKVVSLQTGKAKTGIKIYPTTTTGVLTVENDGQTVDAITVFNHVGQVVFTAKSTNSLTISHLSAGLYFVQVQAGQERVVERVFKQ